MARYDIVLLDADRTLFDFDQAERNAFEKTLTEYGIVYSAEVLLRYQDINNALWAQFERGEIDKKSLYEGRFDTLFSQLGVEIDSARFNQEYLLAIGEGSQLLPGAETLCRALYGTCRLCIATNGYARTQRMRLDNSALAPYISDLFISEAIGWQKPDPRFFDAVFEMLNHPDRARMIILGDSLTSDIRGGLQAGIDTCLFAPDGRMESGVIRPHYRVRTLEAFIPLVLNAEHL